MGEGGLSALQTTHRSPSYEDPRPALAGQWPARCLSTGRPTNAERRPVRVRGRGDRLTLRYIDRPVVPQKSRSTPL